MEGGKLFIAVVVRCSVIYGINIRTMKAGIRRRKARNTISPGINHSDNTKRFPIGSHSNRVILNYFPYLSSIYILIVSDFHTQLRLELEK